MRNWLDYLILVIVYVTFACIWASALLLYGIWYETRMVLDLMNGGCLP